MIYVTWNILISALIFHIYFKNKVYYFICCSLVLAVMVSLLVGWNLDVSRANCRRTPIAMGYIAFSPLWIDFVRLLQQSRINAIKG